ncbi:5-deoxy-glucuronate isomerase [soil metagenome]|nr:5-deoxy-glucuronate isomerase [Trueperaceae bacterium]
MQYVFPARRQEALQAHVTPTLAGWRFLSFEVHRYAAHQTWQTNTGADEACIVLLAGHVCVTVAGETWDLEGRANVFAGLPYAIYLPPEAEVALTMRSDAEFALARAPASGTRAARLIRPSDVRVEIRGGHNATRQVNHILDEGGAEHLLCVEVYTPSGNWSGYPPHKHDVQDPPHEVDLEETYHYRFDPREGWALQRIYTDDRRIDTVLQVRDGDTIIVREGYHPVVTAPGYDCYYLNFLAGATPLWMVRDDPDLVWVRDAWSGAPGRLRLPLGGAGGTT